jgi:hypothetical protein
MSLHHDSRYFDVIGTGFVHEDHADETYRHLIDDENGATGSAWVWLGFYVMAVLGVVGANATHVAPVVLASAK